jgi:hypothetical protein
MSTLCQRNLGFMRYSWHLNVSWSLITAFSPKAKEYFCTPAILFCVLQKCTLKKGACFLKVCYHISFQNPEFSGTSFTCTSQGCVLEYFVNDVCVCVCVISLNTEFHMPNFRGSLFVAIKWKPSKTLFYILQIELPSQRLYMVQR